MISTRGEAESGGEVAPVESGQTDAEKEEFVKISLLHGTWLKEHSFPLIWEGDELELPSVKRKTQRDLLQKIIFSESRRCFFRRKEGSRQTHT